MRLLRASALTPLVAGIVWSASVVYVTGSTSQAGERPQDESVSPPSTAAGGEAAGSRSLEARAGRLNARLLGTRSLTPVFAGLRIASRDPFAIEVYSTDPTSRLIRRAVDRLDLGSVTSVRRVDHTLSELRGLQMRLFERGPFRRITSGIDLERNAVELMPTRRQTSRRENLHRVPNRAFLTVVDESAMPASGRHNPRRVPAPTMGTRLARVSVPGGSQLFPECTGGFVVRHRPSGDRRLSTAGHCGNDLSAQLPHYHSLNFRGETEGTSFDFQWHSHPDVGFPAKIHLGSHGDRKILAKRPKAWQAVGMRVCKFGSNTGWNCGIIEDTSVCPTYIPSCDSTFHLVVNQQGDDLASSNDSGGPVHRGRIALGLISGSLDDEDLVYMPQNYLSFRRLRVVISQG